MKISGLNILFTTSHFPLPPYGGDRIKQLHIIKHLAKNNNVILLSMDRGINIEKKYIDELESSGIIVYPVHLDNFKAYLSGLINSPKGKPLEVEFFRNKLFMETLNDITKQYKIDLLINYFIRTAEFVKDLPYKKILIADDCRSYYQKRTMIETDNIQQYLIRLYESQKLKKYEAEIVNYFDVVTLVTENDKEQMQNLNQNANYQLLPHGIDTEEFQPANFERNDLLFVGKLDVWINKLMLKKIINDIMPQLNEINPNLKMNIVGFNPSNSLLRKQNQNIIVHSNVEDIRPFLQKAAVFVHPHAGGSGLQNKVLESMACGCPVVTTNSGARGINIINGENGFIAKNTYELIKYIDLLINDKKLAAKISINARKLMLDNYQWSKMEEKLDKIIYRL